MGWSRPEIPATSAAVRRTDLPTVWPLFRTYVGHCSVTGTTLTVPIPYSWVGGWKKERLSTAGRRRGAKANANARTAPRKPRAGRTDRTGRKRASNGNVARWCRASSAACRPKPVYLAREFPSGPRGMSRSSADTRRRAGGGAIDCDRGTRGAAVHPRRSRLLYRRCLPGAVMTPDYWGRPCRLPAALEVTSAVSTHARDGSQGRASRAR